MLNKMAENISDSTGSIMKNRAFIENGIPISRDCIYLANDFLNHDLFDEMFYLQKENSKLFENRCYIERHEYLNLVDLELRMMCSNMMYFESYIKEIKDGQLDINNPDQSGDFWSFMHDHGPPRFIIFGSHIMDKYSDYIGRSDTLNIVRVARNHYNLNIPMIVSEENKEYWGEFGDIWVPRDELRSYVEKEIFGGKII